MAVGYKKDENFKPVIHKAMELCSLNRQDVNYHFPLMQQMIEIGKGGHRKDGHERGGKAAIPANKV